MLRFRQFTNVDPPVLAEIWRSLPHSRSWVQPMTAADFDRYVLSRIIFDRRFLIIAENDDRAIGFAHMAPAPGESLSSLDWTESHICLLAVAHPDQNAGAGGELLSYCENLLAEAGSKTIHVGGPRTGDPFYLGLYRGAVSGGVLASDSRADKLFRKAGYEQTDAAIVMHRELAGFRPPIDRKQREIRREFNVAAQLEPTETSWWHAAAIGQSERFRFLLQPRNGSTIDGSVLLWDLEPLASSWGVHAMGICNIEMPADERRKGLATFLLGESLRQIHSQGVTQVEAHVPVENEPALSLLKKLGFDEIDRTHRFKKTLSANA